MKYTMLLTTETAMKALAARSQISVFVCSSIGVSPVGLQPAKPRLPTTQGVPLARARAWSRRHSERSARRLERFSDSLKTYQVPRNCVGAHIQRLPLATHGHG